jgi:hypothetical protein
MIPGRFPLTPRFSGVLSEAQVTKPLQRFLSRRARQTVETVCVLSVAGHTPLKRGVSGKRGLR